MNQLWCVLSPIAKVGDASYCVGHLEDLFRGRAEALIKDPARKAAYDGAAAGIALYPTCWGYYKTIYSARGKIKRRIIKREKYINRPDIVAKVDQQILHLLGEEEAAIIKKKDLNKKTHELRKPKRQWDNALRSRMLEGVGED